MTKTIFEAAANNDVNALNAILSGSSSSTASTTATALPGYITHKKINGDGDCGYKALGMTREEAYQELIKNIGSNSEVQRLVGLVVGEVLHEEAALLTGPNVFFQYLHTQKIIFSDIKLQK